MSHSAEHENPAAGFTLIEVLVALAIVALVLSPLGALIATSVRSTRSIEERLARLETARALVTALPDRKQLGPERLSGEIGGQPWRVEVTPFAVNGAPQSGPWISQAVVITVNSGNGGATQVNTIRLQRRDPK